MPYKTEETAECPICGETIFKHNSSSDFESEVTTIENTIETYRSRIFK